MRFEWPRFWVEHGGTVDLSDDGYLTDPTRTLSRSPPRTLEELGSARAMTLLGEPGTGKSVALKTEADRQISQGEPGTIIFHADLRAYSSDLLLNAKVFESPELTRWKAGTEHLVLYLDSLDEALLRIETVASFIADELARLPTDRLSVRIACRTLDWHTVAPILAPVFKSIWPGDGDVGVFEIAPLRRQDVLTAAATWPVEAERFMEQVWAASVVPFAIKPLTLNLLLRLFHTDGELPVSIAELYRRGCLSLCEEQSASRAPRRQGRLTPPERAQLAGRIATVSMLANRYAVWTGLESGEVPEEDVTASVLAVGDETTPARTFAVTRDELREVLDTGLFSSRGDDRMGWAHQSYAEFLAAEYLIARRVPAHNVLDALRHPSGGLIPQLSMVAAWAASLDKAVRRELIEHEPVVLLHGDLTGWDDEDRGTLATALLDALSNDRAHDFNFGQDARYRKLGHLGLSAIVRPYIVDETANVTARRAALRMAEACHLGDLRDDILSLALNEAANDHIRACAVSALKTCGDEAAWLAMRPLALGNLPSDRNHEIKGHAVSLLWPDHLDAATLFQNIAPPRENFFGAYASFLTLILPKTLQPGDLPTALRWATAFADSSDHMGGFHLKRLADSILRSAWPHIQATEITPLVVDYVRAAVRKHHTIHLGSEHDGQREFRAEVALDSVGRRAFIRAALAAPAEDHLSYWLFESGLLLRDDLAWLLSLGRGGSNEAVDLDGATLVQYVGMCVDLGDDAQFSLLYDAAQQWPLLHSTYALWLDGVALDSPQANDMRRYHDRATQREARPKLDPPPEVRIAERLAQFEAGDLDGWWLLFRELTLVEGSTHYHELLNYRITSQPGWINGDDALRQRILVAARVFLEGAIPSISQWMGGSQVNFSDLAAYRALVLLREQAGEVYYSLAPTVWLKWAPLVVTVPKDSGTEQSELNDAITAEAMAAAPEAIAETASELIRRERAQPTAAGQAEQSTLPPFYFLNQLAPTTAHPALVDALLAELDNAENTPPQYASLLIFLLKAGSNRAVEHGLEKLRSWPQSGDRELALAISAAFLEDGGLVGWPSIWQSVQADQDFGQELFLRIVQHFRFDGSRFASLPEAEHGDLCVWFEEVFPHGQDEDRDGVHWVSPRVSASQLRDGVLGVLVQRGTPEAVAALRSVASRLPSLPWLAYRVLEADQLMRQRTWQPLTPADVMRLVDNADGRLVQSPEQLADILVAMLRVYEGQLHGEQSPINSLWNRQLRGNEMHPKEEDALSDHVKLFLQGALVERGMVLNREVEIGRVPGAPVGTRTDIRVDAVRRAKNGDRFDAITAIIETKGCWNAGLKTAMQTQLHDDYLVRTGAPVGIYLVGWFDKTKWTTDDGRRARTPDWTVAEAQKTFDDQAARLSAGFIVRAVVLDCHAP